MYTTHRCLTISATRVPKARGAAPPGQPGVCSSRSETLSAPVLQASLLSSPAGEMGQPWTEPRLPLKKSLAHGISLLLSTRNPRGSAGKCCDVATQNPEAVPVCELRPTPGGPRPLSRLPGPRPWPALLMAAASQGTARKAARTLPGGVRAAEPAPGAQVRGENQGTSELGLVTALAARDPCPALSSVTSA